MPRERIPAARAFPNVNEIKAKTYPVRVGLREAEDELVVAFDLSTTCIGWAVGTKGGKLVNHGKIVLQPTRPLGERLFETWPIIETILKTYHPVRGMVEQPPPRFGNTTAGHNQVLGFLSFLMYDVLGLVLDKADMVSPKAVKKKLGVPKGDNHDHNKAIMVAHVNKCCGLKLKYIEGSKLKTDDDTADAIAVLLYLWSQ